MKFIGYNRKFDDCMIVAIYNLLVGVGKRPKYDKIHDLCVKNNWYIPGQGFKCAHADEALAHFGVAVRPIRKNMTTKGIHRRVTRDRKVYMFLRPSEWGGQGHAMVATKGKVGVKVHNAYYSEGWKGLSREIKKGVKHYTFEVVKL